MLYLLCYLKLCLNKRRRKNDIIILSTHPKENISTFQIIKFSRIIDDLKRNKKFVIY